ncbi:phospholipid-transporting ATPase ABCA3 [Octopus bimaculoides]|uniref:ABC transporter domain-containing protein n=1 Tax=Octopus bimaculoides TaxID=37653 RepID=A0A0L8GMY3_OCTBM|nr:phospholipid-transporting ATPase ABCA3 [Octopus bimaculoides]|eukprot:XP_014779561.1 PREDICTED: ATP-binding cassette sub-family A member 3-like [Octopus bimaculoides]
MSKLHNIFLVLWKNWIVIKRKHILSLAEILLPCIFMVLLMGIRNIIDSENYAQITTWEPCNITEKEITSIVYAPNNSFENDIMDWMQRTQNIKSKGFSSENEMIDYLVSRGSFYYNGGIVFENKSSSSIFDVMLKIRLPTILSKKQVTWSTDRMFPLFQTFQPRQKGSVCGSRPSYKDTGFFYLQYKLAEGIITYLNASSEDFFNRTTVDLNRQPFPPYNNDPMVLVLQNQFPLILILSFLLCAIHIVKDIIQEKELRLKEAMKMMGLDNWIIWLGWFIKYFIFILISISMMTLFLCVGVADKGSVVGYTNPAILFLFFFTYALATIMFCFLLSTFFSKANSGAVAGGALFFFSYIPYLVLASRYSTLSWGTKIGCCLISNIALAFGGQVLGIFEGQGIGIQWSNLAHGSSVDDDFAFLHVILMLLLDSVIYGILTWYIEAVFPGQYGVPQKWYFPFMMSYWCGTTQTKCKSGALGPAHEELQQYFEAEPNNLKPGIQIKNLYKEFNGGKKVAVDDLNLNMYEGQITALLGHNGAGKTTTLSMITGLIPPSSGTAIVNGYDIRTDMKSVRSSLGICPQHDILFEMLTVKEHLQFFAQLKGFSKKLLKSEVDKMINSINLEDKRNVLSKNLSGGMKRRLSLGIALIGDSKIVILDEPSSGLDPNARRQVWSVLEKHRMGRTMLLTTHFMDEADHLGDRIAIISDGILKCAGSSLFLKSKYGAGYHLVIVKTPQCNVANVTHLLKSFVPEATMESNVGAELSYLLPHESSCYFEKLFNTIQSKQANLGISNYGVSVTTMEEVFLKVSDNLNTQPVNDSHTFSNGSVYHTLETTFKPSRYKKITGFFLSLQQFRAMFVKKVIYTWRNKFLSISQILVPLVFTIIALIVVKTFPTQDDFPSLLLSPEKYGKNTIPFSILLTATPEVAGITMSYQDKSLNKDINFVNINNSTKSKNSPNITKYLGVISIEDRENYNDHYMIAADLSATFPDHYIAYFNGQSFHSGAISLAMMVSGFLRYFHQSTSKISFVNHPLPVTQSEAATSSDSLNNTAFTLSIMILFGISFLSATFSLFVIKERCTKSKHLQYISGVYPFNFWISVYIWDMITFFVTSICVIIAFVCFDIEAYIVDGHSAAILLLFFLYSTAALPFTYLLSFIFKTPTSGFVWLALINIVSGLLSVLSVNILSIPQLNLSDVADILRWVFLVISPEFCLGQGLIDFYANYDLIEMCDKFPSMSSCQSSCTECLPLNRNYLGWEGKGIGKSLVFLCIQNIFTLFLLILVESSVFEKIVYSLKLLCSRNKIQTVKDVNGTTIDNDVAAEQVRVENYYELHKDVIVVKDVSKLYGSFMAVNHISVGIPAGECFGLLGINGAGKTSTFKMLTGDERISSGMIYINGVSLKTNIRQIQRYVGYCPQFDALIECLTAREILNMFALIRGVPQKIIPQTVNDLIEELMLQKYADKQVKTYSGGNKRKLSTAVALIGDPPVVLLDEPTTGMDPGTRRNLWNTLIKVRDTGRTLILTSHSMDECEALCTKIAIMVNGQFRCYGSIQHLKSKFGEGYTLIAKVKHQDSNGEPPNLYPLMNFIENSLPGSTLNDKHEGLVYYQIPKNPEISWSQMFGTLEQAKYMFNVEAYSLGQTSLEQVFINFARLQVTRT